MTDAELIDELISRQALIVHCSRPGKGDDGLSGLLFPEDLKKAIHICARKSKELCCSVVWPGHVETFGEVGIVLKPRSTASITSICTTDGGTHVDPVTCRRVGMGDPFSRQAVIDTFTCASTYNEWNVDNADTVGIFVLPAAKWQVAKLVPATSIPGYQPDMADLLGGPEVVGQVWTTIDEIETNFPGLPILSIAPSGIVRWREEIWEPIDAASLYR